MRTRTSTPSCARRRTVRLLTPSRSATWCASSSAGGSVCGSADTGEVASMQAIVAEVDRPNNGHLLRSR